MFKLVKSDSHYGHFTKISFVFLKLEIIYQAIDDSPLVKIHQLQKKLQMKMMKNNMMKAKEECWLKLTTFKSVKQISVYFSIN